MVEYSNEQQLNLIFQALADPTRRRLLLKVQNSPQRVTDLATEFEVSLNAVSKHIKVLEKAKLIVRRVDGRTHYCEPNPKQLVSAEKWIKTYTSFWTDTLDRLENVIDKKTKEKK